MNTILSRPLNVIFGNNRISTILQLAFSAKEYSVYSVATLIECHIPMVPFSNCGEWPYSPYLVS